MAKDGESRELRQVVVPKWLRKERERAEKAKPGKAKHEAAVSMADDVAAQQEAAERDPGISSIGNIRGAAKSTAKRSSK